MSLSFFVLIFSVQINITFSKCYEHLHVGICNPTFIGWRLEALRPFWTSRIGQLDTACVMTEKEKRISQVSCCFCSLRARSWPRVLTLIQAVVRHLSLAGVDVIINPAVQLREFVSLNVLSTVWLDKTGNIFTSWMYHPILPTTAFIV